MIKDKKILITGIYGFLGTHLAKKLQFNNEVIGINLPNSDSSLSDIKIIEGDLSDSETLQNINTDIDFIFHFGSPTSVVQFKKRSHQMFQ